MKTKGLRVQKKRCYINIYYEDGCSAERKKKDITLSFSEGDPIYGICKEMGSGNIRKVSGLSSYKEIRERAKKEGRSISNYVKNTIRRQKG